MRPYYSAYSTVTVSTGSECVHLRKPYITRIKKNVVKPVHILLRWEEIIAECSFLCVLPFSFLIFSSVEFLSLLYRFTRRTRIKIDLHKQLSARHDQSTRLYIVIFSPIFCGELILKLLLISNHHFHYSKGPAVIVF